MIVTEIIAITKSRYKVVLDGIYSFVLYKGELRRFHIQQGEELDETVYQSIIQEILPKRAKLRCMNLLKSRDYTRKQLEDKLRQGEYPEEIVEEALAYVESYGYVDDVRYARNFVEYNMQKKSRIRMENDLQRKGIHREVISQVFDELEENGIEIDEIAMIWRLLDKKDYCAETATEEERQRMYGFLYRKGFHGDMINKALYHDRSILA